MSDQFHFHPDQYLSLVRAEVPTYDELQDEMAAASDGMEVRAILDLGSGTGETARRVARRYPEARLLGIDASEAMLEHARTVLPAATFRVSRLEDPLPDGLFDLVVSALAVHHLDGPGKADLFVRVASVLSPAGRFVLGDVVVPDDPDAAVTPLDPAHDHPSRVDDMMRWLTEAGLHPRIQWTVGDLAVLVADLPRGPGEP